MEGIRAIQVKTAKYALRVHRPDGRGWRKERWMLTTWGSTKRRLAEYRVDAFVAVTPDRSQVWIVAQAGLIGSGATRELRSTDRDAWGRIGTPRSSAPVLEHPSGANLELLETTGDP